MPLIIRASYPVEFGLSSPNRNKRKGAITRSALGIDKLIHVPVYANEQHDAPVYLHRDSDPWEYA
jgi:hypothetical protein